tara:strand:+ start:68 stop:667 length:600 start_codon:yes stop_codon:yes gene_type:complete
MAYFLGRDVKVALTTEDADNGIGADGLYEATDNAMFIPSLDFEGETAFAGALGAEVTNPFADVVGVDISLGAIDEDITYMGQRTVLKAEVKKETTMSLTLKKSTNFWSLVWRNARWGLNTAGSDEHDGLTKPGIDTGYRFHIQLKSSAEVISVPNCTLTGYSVSLNPDGVQEESIELISHVTPVVQTTAYTTATDPAAL